MAPNWMKGFLFVLFLTFAASPHVGFAESSNVTTYHLDKTRDYVIEETGSGTFSNNLVEMVHRESKARYRLPLTKMYGENPIFYQPDEVLLTHASRIERFAFKTGESTMLSIPGGYESLVDTDPDTSRILVKLYGKAGIVVGRDGTILHRFEGERFRFLANGDVFVAMSNRVDILDAATYEVKTTFETDGAITILTEFEEAGEVFLRTEQSIYLLNDATRTWRTETFAEVFHTYGAYLHNKRLYMLDRDLLVTYNLETGTLVTEPLEYDDLYASVSISKYGISLNNRRYAGDNVLNFPTDVSLRVPNPKKEWYTNTSYYPEVRIKTLGGQTKNVSPRDALPVVPEHVVVGDDIRVTKPGALTLVFETEGLKMNWYGTFYDFVPLTFEGSGTLTAFEGTTAPNTPVWIRYRQAIESKDSVVSTTSDETGRYRYELATPLFSGATVRVSHSTATSRAETVQVVTQEREPFDNGVTLLSIGRVNGAYFKAKPGQTVELTYNDPYMWSGATAVADSSGIARFKQSFPDKGRVYYKLANESDGQYRMTTVTDVYALPYMEVTDVLLMKTNAVFTVKRETTGPLRFYVDGQLVTSKALSATRHQFPVKPGATVKVVNTSQGRVYEEEVTLPKTTLSVLTVNDEIDTWTGIFLPNSTVTLTGPSGVTTAKASSTGRVTLKFPRFTKGQAVTLLSRDGRLRHQQKMTVTEGVTPKLTIGALTSASQAVSVTANVNYGTLTVMRGTSVLATRNVTTKTTAVAIPAQRKGTKLTVKLVTPRGKATTQLIEVK